MDDPAKVRAGASAPRTALQSEFQAIRAQTMQLTAPLAIEDYVVQSAPEVSPIKWHLAHTTWFFEAFVLAPFVADFREFHPKYGHLFNSYYQSIGKMHAREGRGLLSRPTVREVQSYRQAIDEQVAALLTDCDEARWAEVATRIRLGLHHEQQHQELMLMDIKHVFSVNPLNPLYRKTAPLDTTLAPALRFHAFAGGRVATGHQSGEFCYDNELPRHDSLIAPYRLANRCVTSGEFAEFIADGGYERPEHWLADGWSTRLEQGWQAPLYWQREGSAWSEFRLAGLQPIDENGPVVHVSYYEADAYARWAGCRLPSEFEWEQVAALCEIRGNFVESGHLHPRPAAHGDLVEQLFGDVWEITRSPYSPYPGFRPLPGSLGEYNGKFMSGQMVHRGGSCATPQAHMRASYRNFYPPHQRWSFQGFRLAADAS